MTGAPTGRASTRWTNRLCSCRANYPKLVPFGSMKPNRLIAVLAACLVRLLSVALIVDGFACVLLHTVTPKSLTITYRMWKLAKKKISKQEKGKYEKSTQPNWIEWNRNWCVTSPIKIMNKSDENACNTNAHTTKFHSKRLFKAEEEYINAGGTCT